MKCELLEAVSDSKSSLVQTLVTIAMYALEEQPKARSWTGLSEDSLLGLKMTSRCWLDRVIQNRLQK
jgi:hypothetical protein